jgi:hypothetical protein
MSRHVHVVGSVPYSNEGEVFTIVSSELGPIVRRIPDGETASAPIGSRGWNRSSPITRHSSPPASCFSFTAPCKSAIGVIA